jgi:hypothetical protein
MLSITKLKLSHLLLERDLLPFDLMLLRKLNLLMLDLKLLVLDLKLLFLDLNMKHFDGAQTAGS